MAKKRGSNGQSTLDVPTKTAVLDASFGGMNYGKEKASTQITIRRALLCNDDAVDLLCKKRLRATIETGGDATSDRQLPGMEDDYHRLDAVIETAKLGTGVKEFTATGNINLSDLDDEADLLRFRHKPVRLSIHDVEVLVDSETGEPIRSDDEEEHPDVAAGKDRPHGTPALEAAAKAKAAKEHYCGNCEHRWPLDGEKASECPECQSDSFDVHIVGYGGDPNVNEQGVFVAGFREPVTVKMRRGVKHSVTITAVQGVDSKWRAAAEYEADGEGATFKAEVKDGRPSEVEAVKARAGQVFDLWKKGVRGLSDEQKERRKKALEDLQKFIGAADREPGTIFDKAGA